MAARPIGTFYLSFGLVTIPVKMYSASQTSETISFRMLHKACKTPLKQQYICPKDGETVDRENTVKGYEFAKDQYVVFTPEELKAVEEESSKTIAIAEFVPLQTVDSVYFDKPYYLGPDKGGERAYKLLSEAMKQTGLSALARYSARGKQYIVLLRPGEQGMILQQLHYANEIRPFSEVPLGDQSDIKDAELKLAIQLIQQSVSEKFSPEKYQDDVRQRVQEIIQRKVEGEEVTLAMEEAPIAPVIDLMEALKASLAQAAPSADSKPAKVTVLAERKPAKQAPRAKKAAKVAGEGKRASR